MIDRAVIASGVYPASAPATRCWWLAVPWLALLLCLSRLALRSLALRSISGVYTVWAVASLPLWALSSVALPALKSVRLSRLWLWAALELAATVVAQGQSRIVVMSGGVLRGAEGWFTLTLLAATPVLVTAAMVRVLVGPDERRPGEDRHPA